jgi:hypothetical protein
LISKATDWLLKTQDDKKVLWQFPNWQLGLAIALWVMAVIIDTQPYNNLFTILYPLALLYWASLEIKEGVNRFRIILGAVVFAVILSGFFNQFF